MDKSNSVPTAIAVIIIFCLAVGVFGGIKKFVGENQEKIHEQALEEIGSLPSFNVNINGYTYIANTQVSYAAQNFIKNTPITIEMKDDGSDKKIGCLLVKIEGDCIKEKNVEKGDVLLYGESCIIIATEDFKNSAQYKKIGHINNLGTIPSGIQKVSFSIVK